MVIRGNKPPILIIGASGFIGSCLTKRLLADDYSVIAISGERGLEYLEGTRDKKLKAYSYKEVVNNFKKLGRFRFLFNLSGYTDIRESFKVPLKYETNKPITTIKLIEECRTDKFINISTASVYNFAYNPLSEKGPLKPLSPYAISQLTADYYTDVLCNYHKIPYLILRIFNPYGPPNTKRGIIATTINGLLNKEKISLYNPMRKFDFTFIDDVVRAIIFSMDKFSGIVNVGSGRPVSLIDVYKKICFILFKSYEKPNILKSNSYNEEVYSNSNKLKKSGFHFKYSINEGLSLTAEYFKKLHMPS